MDKFTRQLNVVALLQQAGSTLTFSDIRTRLAEGAYPQRDPESARRSFERDKADLLEMGVPLQTVVNPEDPSASGYRIASGDHSISDPGFTPGELAALRFAATAVALRGETVDSVAEAADGLRKYGGVGNPTAPRTLADVNMDENLSTLFSAIIDSAAVGFTYAGRTRRIAPSQLANRAGRWYLRSSDLDALESRTYRLDRIQGAVLRLRPEDVRDLDEQAVLTAPTAGTLRIRPWEFGDNEPVRVLVALDPPAAAVAIAEDPDLEIADAGPLNTTVALAVRNPVGLWPWILSFLDRAELLEPRTVREAYLDHVRALVDATPCEPLAEGEA